MSKNKKKTQDYLLMHSRAKVELLGNYLDRYLNIIANTHVEKIHVFDLFSAEGIYKNGGHGSPIIILSKIKNLHEINSGKNKNIPQIEVVFNDYDKSKIEKLKKNIKAESLDRLPKTTIKYRAKDYKEIVKVLPDYLEKKKQDKFFIFIDPYGYKEIDSTEIKSLLNSRNSEVLLFQPTQFMFRFESSGTIPESLDNFIKQIMPDVNKHYDDIWQFIIEIKEGFRRFMGEGYYVDTFTIQRDSNTVFCLFFFSGHIKGFEKMLEAKWEIDKEKGEGWKFERTRDIFNLDLEKNKLEEHLMKYLKEKRNNVELYEFVLGKGYLPKHCNEVLKFLQKNNKLFYIGADDKPIPKNSFYINYENYRRNLVKGIFQLK
ncbi:MAG: three-Cys-motif partner protein TcmP [Flavobacteriales bacterium]|nr:three-Cys-motif partner protein TcmP [Flavobacteriales bacterium]